MITDKTAGFIINQSPRQCHTRPIDQGPKTPRPQLIQLRLVPKIFPPPSPTACVASLLDAGPFPPSQPVQCPGLPDFQVHSRREQLAAPNLAHEPHFRSPNPNAQEWHWAVAL